MSYIEKMCLVNWRFRSFVQYIYSKDKDAGPEDVPRTLSKDKGSRPGQIVYLGQGQLENSLPISLHAGKFS